jgi:uncharacterized membrane protein (UPF0136 family)
MQSSGMLRPAALVRTHVSEEGFASITRVTKIGKLGTTLVATSNRNMLHAAVFIRIVKDSQVVPTVLFVLSRTVKWSQLYYSYCQRHSSGPNCIIRIVKDSQVVPTVLFVLS